MKFVWVIEGGAIHSSAYQQQMELFSNTLYQYGIESAIANPVSFVEQEDETLSKITEWKPDVIVSFGGVHPVEWAEQTGIPMLCWFFHGGSDKASASPAPGVTFAGITRFAVRKLREVGVEALYVPHAFDPGIFYPGRRKAARGRLGWQHEDQVAVMVGTNYGGDTLDRKNWAGALDAFASYHKAVPASRLFVHASAEGAINIPQYAEKLDIPVEMSDQSKFVGVQREFGPEYIADLYRASDVLLMPSLAEGFGVPLIEAQACGLPVVTTNDGGPMQELAITGTAVDSLPHPDREAWHLPITLNIEEALLKWMKWPGPDRQGTSMLVNKYAVENVVEYNFIPALEVAAS